jgi:uncharacterized cupin superfamily protein
MTELFGESPTDPTRHRVPIGIFREPGVGEKLEFSGIRHLFRLTAYDTEGRFGLEEFEVPPGTTGVAPHIHDGHDEYFYILEGQLTVWAGDSEVIAEAGAVVAAVRGVPHGYRNATQQLARALCLYTPAGYEAYFREVHAAVTRGEKVSDEDLVEYRRKYATRPYQPQ